MDFQLSKFVNHVMELCFSNLLDFGELDLTVTVSLSPLIGIPFKISHVYLGNLKYENGKNQTFRY